MLSCFDRVLIQGILPGLSYSKGITAYFYARGLLIKDYPHWAEPLTQQVRENVQQLAGAAGIEIQFIRKASVRKEEIVREVIHQRGDHPGLVCILSAMERCSTYKAHWRDGPPHLVATESKCLHYYLYFIDEELGLCSVRVPTWPPFRLQIYFNGHRWLERQLKAKGIACRLLDNAFVWIADFDEAQGIADRFRSQKLHRKLDQLAALCCPVVHKLEATFHWSIDQAEYATDIVFHRRQDLQPIYENLTRSVIQAVKANDIATFLGKKIYCTNDDEIGNRYDVRIEGTRIRHTMGPASIKMYDKFGHIFRVETTINDLTFLPHYREVEQRNGQRIFRWAAMKKNIHSWHPLQEALRAANRRYLEFLAALDTPSAGPRLLDRICRTLRDGERSYRGLNFFSAPDAQMLQVLARGEFNIQGFRNKDLRHHLGYTLSTGQTSRLLKSQRLHGLIKKTGRSYKYYLSSLGKQVVATALYLKSLIITPRLAALHSAVSLA